MDKEKAAIIKQEIITAIAAESDPAKISRLFDEILTESEMSNIAMRWELMKRLMSGSSQRHIAEDLGLSLCKITRGSKILKNSDSVVRGYLQEVLQSSKP